MAYTNRELFARLIRCEAGGEGDDGMRAVATVVMNRVNVSSGEYQRVCQGDIRKVITQRGQFACAAEEIGGVVNPQSIFTNPPEQVHYDIADWALGGGLLNNAGNSLWFLNPGGQCQLYFPANGSGVHHTRIVDHCFYRPTAKYSST